MNAIRIANCSVLINFIHQKVEKTEEKNTHINLTNKYTKIYTDHCRNFYNYSIATTSLSFPNKFPHLINDKS